METTLITIPPDETEPAAVGESNPLPVSIYGPNGMPEPFVNWWDRNPIVRHLVYDADGVAVHSQTVRKTYTCPAGKILIVVSGFIHLNRATASTGTATARSFCRILRYNDVSFPFCGAALTSVAVPSVATSIWSGLLIVGPGEDIDITTKDGNADGTVDYSSCIVAYEIDATPGVAPAVP